MDESTSPKSGRSILNLDGPLPEVRTPHPSSMPYSSSFISPLSSSPSTTVYSDRFIPSRTGSNFALFNLARSPPRTSSSVSSDGVSGNGGFGTGTGTYSAALRSVIFGFDDDDYVSGNVSTPVTPGQGDPIVSTSGRRVGSGVNRNIFRYMTDVGGGERVGGYGPFEDSPLPGVVSPSPMVSRKVSRTPYKVLDAPALQDDFYLNLVDWSPNNVLAVGLGNCVYLWNACTSKVTKLCELGTDDSVCSVGWGQRGTHLSVGTNLGEVQIWDATKCQKLRTMEGHRLRVGALAWSMSILSSGGRDKTILHHDIRSPNDCVMKLTGHKSEVCGLKWSYDNCQLASGGNDNKLLIWNQHSRHPVLKYCEHTAAVKAIAWSPHLNGLLASGGGTADRCIRFWNTTTNTQLSSLNTGSQVCNLVWSKNVNEVVSTHGYSQNQIIVWRYPTMSKIATLTGHTFRVLYLTISPDGQTIVTGAGDETLRFWNVFPCSKSQNTARDIGSTSLGRSHIR